MEHLRGQVRMSDLSCIEFVPAPSSARRGTFCRGSNPEAAEPLVVSPPEPRPESNSGANPVFASLFKHCGVDVSTYRPDSLERRVPALLRRLRVQSLSDAQRRLELYPELRPVALDCLLLGVSYFFRDPPVFEFLRCEALPALLAQRPGIGLRVLSSGSSDGRELYSIAILLDELKALQASHLLGIDCKPGAIAHARTASYTLSDLGPLDSALRSRWFTHDGSQVRLRPEIAQAAEFRVADLCTMRSGQEWDVILCRNVIMYFNAPAAGSVWCHLESQLSQGGLLVTGKAEQPPRSLGLTRIGPCVYRKGC